MWICPLTAKLHKNSRYEYTVSHSLESRYRNLFHFRHFHPLLLRIVRYRAFIGLLGDIQTLPRQKIPYEKFDSLFVYCLLGIVIGARLGHCLFYEPGYWLSHPVEMLLPVKITDSGIKWTGYQGLASHGGTIGLMLALWIYSRRVKLKFLTVLDNIAIATPLAGCFIRLGNLMNGEIVGTVTHVPWAFIFPHEDMQPRHPAQLYEAIAYLLIFIIGLRLYKKYKTTLYPGFYFGYCLTTIFTFRFLVEFIKASQEAFEDSMMLNMGQWLSIPFILLGAHFMYHSFKPVK